jgi:DNA replication protein DnaC
MDEYIVNICEKHGEYKASLFKFGIIDMCSGCPECEKERDFEEEEKRKVEEERGRIAWNRNHNIEEEYDNATLQNIEILTPEHERAVKYAKEIIADRRGKLVLLGANGTGKTHIAISVVKELNGKIFSMYEISARIRASYVSGAKETELDIVEELARLPILVIDEIGRTKGSDAETNWLSYIIDKRHVRHLPIILISNKHLNKTCEYRNTPQKGCKDCLENYISEDIMSRLSEDGYLVTFKEGDYRKIKRTRNIV